jgi:uncharacterized LabA/DUF88 family protein
MAKVAILVDNMYLENAASLFGAYPSDLTKLPKVVMDSTDELHKTYVFDALPYAPRDNPTAEQVRKRAKKSEYLEALQYKERIAVELGYVAPKTKKCPSCNVVNIVPVQKLVDVRISVRLVSLGWADAVDKIILVAGDADLVPAVEELEKNAMKSVKLAFVRAGNVGTSPALIKVCSEKRELTPQDLQFMKYNKM